MASPHVNGPALVAVVLALALSPARAAVQPPPDSPEALADRVADLFATGTAEEFARAFPFEPGRELLGWAIEHDAPRSADLARVVRRDGDRAVLALGGWVAFGNAGSETWAAKDFSGLYEARRTDSGWALTRALPIDGSSRIRTQALGVTVEPGRGLEVVDTLGVEVGDATGFSTRLVHTARLLDVRVDGAPAPHAFGGGFLWVEAPRGEARLVLHYTVDVARDSTADPNSGRFEAAYGHVRNQYFWHPFFDFQTDADQADFRIVARIPEPWRLATDLPQTETVAGGVREIRARTAGPTFALSLFYDRDWRPVEVDAAGARLAVFATPDFRPSPDSLGRAFEDAYGVLSRHFGAPGAAYLAIVQSRAREGAGWLFRTNDGIAAAVQGGGLTRPSPIPRAVFGHEVSHGWTHPTGSASNLLREGWATLAESYLLEAESGPETVRDFWEMERGFYETGGFEGTATILNDPSNGGVAYSKGSWILRMLRDRIGAAAFEKGMREYVAIPVGEPAGIEELEAAVSRAAGADVRPFLRPWLTESRIPDVRAGVDGTDVVLTETGPVFPLAVELALTTPGGTVRRTAEIAGRVTRVPVGDLGEVTDVLVDPDHRLLLKRHRGEPRARFAVDAPGAKSVALDGNVASEPIPAVGDGRGRWSVTIPVTAGRYAVRWIVDGEKRAFESRVVRPLEPVEDAYPR